MIFNRVFAMPSADTFTVKPIREFVGKYMMNSKLSVDPFARNSGLATITNDLNTNTIATYHLTALDFLAEMEAKDVVADLIFFDPPYTMRQTKEVYESVGVKFDQEASQNSAWSAEKDLCHKILAVGGIFLHFGYHTNGLGKNRDAVVEEILLVNHGGAHYDTICMAERKLYEQLTLI